MRADVVWSQGTVTQDTSTSAHMLSSSHDDSGQRSPDRIVGKEIYDDGCLRVEFSHYFVACKGSPLDLTKTEFLLVARLVLGMERIVKFQELWNFAWPTEKPLNLASLHVYMFKLRRKLQPFGLRIENMINVGYSISHGDCCALAKQQSAPPAGGTC